MDDIYILKFEIILKMVLILFSILDCCGWKNYNLVVHTKFFISKQLNKDITM